jgi:hypothetical protein
VRARWYDHSKKEYADMPDEIKAAELRLYKANNRVKCLEANLKTCHYSEFEEVEKLLEQAQDEAKKAHDTYVPLYTRWHRAYLNAEIYGKKQNG